MGAEKEILMYSRLQIARKYLNYYLTAKNGKGHGVHSPFVYDLIRNVLNDRRQPSVWKQIESMRTRLINDRTWLEVEDLGAGSSLAKSRRRQVGEMARHAAKSPKMGQLLFRIARYYHCERVLELGTSLGITTAYLANAVQESTLSQASTSPGIREKDARGSYVNQTTEKDVRVWSIEGAAEVAAVAARNFEELGLVNVELVVGNFDDRLTGVLDRMGQVDLAFIDGNHRLEPTLRYFHEIMTHCASGAILIFDDIHWSADMEKAWDEIQQDPRVYMTIDLFFIGLVVLRDEFKIKQHFTVRF
jgi:predicted O-methyltransferase YrrM